MVVDPTDDDLADEDGNQKDVGASNHLGQVAKISSEIINDEGQLKRTGAHEFGHMFGLKHPEEDDDSLKDEITGDENNLMWQSKVSKTINTDGKGVNVTDDQIEKVESNFDDEE